MHETYERRRIQHRIDCTQFFYTITIHTSIGTGSCTGSLLSADPVCDRFFTLMFAVFLLMSSPISSRSISTVNQTFDYLVVNLC